MEPIPAREKLDKPRPVVRMATSTQGLSFGVKQAIAMHNAGDKNAKDWHTFLTCIRQVQQNLVSIKNFKLQPIIYNTIIL